MIEKNSFTVAWPKHTCFYHFTSAVNDVANMNFDAVAEEKRVSTKRRRKPKMDSVTMEAIQQNFGKPIGEASKRIGGKLLI